ncbi:Glycerol kinase [Apophysomyces sp. BC1034]|nr:Glycerol kinase [Apophysomyces sp. BC1015]KAG0179812.1 Glycerol kinase [Apophysomyces sp. BC1021]KAG0190397.1 Glycerol kinase [Apophysomyces sp. BC1034]
MTTSFIGAVDQGTTSSRFLIFDNKGSLITFHQEELPQEYPRPGWVEHDPYAILGTVTTCIDKAFKRFELMGYDVKDIKAIGITNQRETTLMWNKKTGKPLHNAIVWSDVRTDELVHTLNKREDVDKVAKSCGLKITSYFSAVKIKWLLENVTAVQEAVKDKTAAFGTVDSWLLYNLSGKRAHYTDVTNASRTLLMSLETLTWDKELLEFFDIPDHIMPTLASSSEEYATMSADSPLAGVPITSCMGDQQAALLGQKCFEKGEAKCTFGTGAFMLFNTGTEPIESTHGLIRTVAFKLGKKPAHYALEGSIAVAGSALRWLRDNLRLINTMEEVSELASHVQDTGGVYFVTAFSGLFAPYWRDDARGTMIGLTSYTNKYHLARATLESMSFQSRAILESMNQDATVPLKVLKVDGGVSNSNVAMQIQADTLGIEVHRPAMRETTALGVAIAAGLAVGVWKDLHELDEVNKDNVSVFVPNLDKKTRDANYATWKKAIQASLDWTRVEF